jgi:anti-sigma-K factor RskA
MGARDLHELTAAYALDALDAEDVEAYEAHLAQCDRCQDDLAGMSEAATARAWATDAPAPPPRLRLRILDAAAAERENVVPLRPRPRLAWVAAAAAACAALGFGVWGATKPSSHGRTVAAVLVVHGTSASLNLTGLGAPPHGKTYEAWVIPKGKAPIPSGLFAGGTSATIRLKSTVPHNAVVAVTVEHAGGARAPTTAPILSTTT